MRDRQLWRILLALIGLQAVQCGSLARRGEMGSATPLYLVVTGENGVPKLSVDHSIKVGETTLRFPISRCLAAGCSNQAMLVNGQRTEAGGVVLRLTPLMDPESAYVPPSVWMELKVDGGRLSPTRIGMAVQSTSGTEDTWLSMVCGNVDVDQERFARDSVIGVAFFLAGIITQGSGSIQTDAKVDVSGFFARSPEGQSSPTGMEEASQFVSIGRN